MTQPMIPPDYKALEKRIAEIQARVEKATAGPWGDNYAHPDVWVELEDEREVCSVLHMSAIEDAEIDDSVFDQAKVDAEFIAHAREDIPFLLTQLQRLQDEIERLKEYVVHQKRCAKWWYHQIEAPHGQLRDGVACSCGLEADRPQCRTCKHYEPIGPSIGLCNGKWGNAAIPPVFGCEQHVEKSCGLAPETGAT